MIWVARGRGGEEAKEGRMEENGRRGTFASPFVAASIPSLALPVCMQPRGRQSKERGGGRGPSFGSLTPSHTHWEKARERERERAMATPLPRSPSTSRRSTGRLRFSFHPCSSRLALLALSSSLLLCFHMAAEGIASRTKTVAGHNLDPTPWHLFPRVKQQLSPLAVFRCHFLSCPRRRIPPPTMPKPRRPCPSFFRWIHRDLQPWRLSRISPAMVAEAGRHAAMRVVILEGKRLFVDLYYACVQSRAMFTIWGLLHLLRRYPGMVPNVDLMFDCMDRPSVNRSEYCPGNGGADGRHLPPLFRYCTTRDHLDIPFPDWSFWGWPEINIKPWDEEFQNIKLGSQTMKWRKRARTAYWKGNPDVQSPIREALLSCNDSKMWGAQIMRQDWVEESRSGFQKSSLSNQCSHRYKIYAEGYSWSVSLKYIMACGSLPLIIKPQYKDFFNRGLVPKENYWPISPTDLCQSIKFAVEWGNQNPSKAEAIGKRGQAFMQELDMDHVYDYMYHLIVEYSKLQDFKPAPPSLAQEVCVESILCVADKQQRELLERSYASPSSSLPCTFFPPS